MGRYMHVSFDIKDTVVDRVARDLGLPETRMDKGDSVSYLTAEDVKTWGEWFERFMSYLEIGNEYRATLIAFHRLHVARCIVAHAEDYINNASMEADMMILRGELMPRKRKDFMREKTKQYRMWFA